MTLLYLDLTPQLKVDFKDIFRNTFYRYITLGEHFRNFGHDREYIILVGGK